VFGRVRERQPALHLEHAEEAGTGRHRILKFDDPVAQSAWDEFDAFISSAGKK
jgi:hypothetical protein